MDCERKLLIDRRKNENRLVLILFKSVIPAGFKPTTF